MKLKNIVFVLIGGVFIFSCSSAQKANEVSAAYVPASQYAGMTCEQLYESAEELRASIPALERRVDKSAKDDKVKEQVAWWLFAPAAFLMDGNADEASQLSIAKGQLDAIRTAAINNKCSS